MTIDGNNDFVEVDTAVPQSTSTPQHNVHDDATSMISSNITSTNEKRGSATKNSTYAVLSMESEEDYYYEDEMPGDEDRKEGSLYFQFWTEHCGLFLPMSGWFLFSALLSSYNKVRFSTIVILCFNRLILSAYDHVCNILILFSSFLF